MSDAQFWDRIARKYAKSAIKDMDSYEETLRRVASYLRRDSRMLEAGCGTGTTALKLAPLVRDYVATDISAGMIEIAREKAAAEGAAVDFRVAPADARDLGPFDVVFNSSLLHLVPDQGATLAAFHDALEPGGLLIAKVPCVGEMSWFLRPAIRVMQAFGRAPFLRYQTAPELIAAVEAAGFDIVESSELPKGKPIRFIVARKR